MMLYHCSSAQRDLEAEPSGEVVGQLAVEVYNSDLLLHLVINLKHMDFEVGGLFCSASSLLSYQAVGLAPWISTHLVYWL